MNKRLQKKLKILNVVGARPNFMKIAPLYRAYAEDPKRVHPVLVHTQQHADESMSATFFRSLGIPDPDHRLTPNRTSPNSLIASVISQLDKILEKEKPDIVVVVGDVNSTLAAAIAASKAGITLAHVESGLRSGDRSMPEEVNRIATDHISDMLFVTEKSGVDNLKGEGVAKSRIFFVGNVMIDTLVSNLPKIDASKILDRFKAEPKKYALITMHRPANVDSKRGLQDLARLMRAVIEETGLPLIFPVHPRTMSSVQRHGLAETFRRIPGLKMSEPLGYTEFMKLVKDSRLILTDSGGIQEEAAYLKVHTVTLRDSTERPATIRCGANRLCHLDDTKGLARHLKMLMSAKKPKIRSIPLYDGEAGRRIVKAMLDHSHIK